MNILELQTELTKRNINIQANEICQIWGMDVSSFSRKKREGTDIKYKNIQQLENALKIDLMQKFPKERALENIKKLQEQSGIHDNSNNIVNVTYRPDVSLSAGYGITVYEEKAETMLLDARLFVSEKGNKIDPQYCEVVKISGNSMFPEYKDGDRVVIDKNCTELIDGHIFAFRYNNQCFVKEINLLGKRIKCISLNKEYDPFYIEEGEPFTVFGRILPRIRL
jgi:phage repressor protein C with HTH and peptisase S24 domain